MISPNRELAWKHSLTARMNVLYYRAVIAAGTAPKELGALLLEYEAHASRFQALFDSGCTDLELKAALDSFSKTQMRESKIHPVPDEALLENAHKEVLSSIHVARSFQRR